MRPDRLAAHFLAVCVFFILQKYVEGQGCSYYGQSCWGGHGKRSSPGSSDWFLSRMVPARRETPFEETPIIAPEDDLVSGGIAAPDAVIARMETNPDVSIPWNRNMQINQQRKMRLYEILSG